MAGTANTEFTLGDKYWCVYKALSQPMIGTIIALTDAPGKTIGLQFDTDDIISRIDCDGRGPLGKCLWTIPQYIYSTDEWDNVLIQMAEQKEAYKKMIGKSFDVMKIDEDNQIVGSSQNSNAPNATNASKLMPAFKE
jgi:hypothetical protein